MPSETLFPLLSSNGPSPSYRVVLHTYQNALSKRIEEGSLRPLVLPYHLYGFLILVVYLCIPHKSHPLVYALRWPVLVIICSFQWKTIRETSSWNAAMSYAGGLISAFGIVWSFTWLVLYRPQWDALRVERRRKSGAYTSPNSASQEEEDPLKIQNEYRNSSRKIEIEATSAAGERYSGNIDQNNRHRKTKALGNGKYKEVINGFPEHTGDLFENHVVENASIQAPNHYDYFWQPYPNSIWERTDWIWDLLVNLRGPGWNWEIPPMPGKPYFIGHNLGDPVDNISQSGISPVGLRRFTSKRHLFYIHTPKFVAGYLILDILKTVMMKDPYFIFGPNSYALPRQIASLSAFQLAIYRRIISFLAITVTLEMAFIFSPLVFCLILGSRLLGLRGEPWYYVTNWGSPSTIGAKGLNGLWGSWWHQTFRFAFAAPTNFLINNGYIQPRSYVAKIVGLLFAFGISGFLHSCASMTQFPKTSVIHPLIFFMLQALGIIIQSSICSILHPYIEKLPNMLRQASNLMYAFGWLFWTASWLTDDFARGGVWLYEPIPLSPLRGLGFGQQGDSWWCWGDFWFHWHTGKHWWESGLAI